MNTETVSMLGLMFIEIQPKHIQLFIFVYSDDVNAVVQWSCHRELIRMSWVLEIFNPNQSLSPENISGNLGKWIRLDNLAKTPLKDTIGILKDEPVVEEKKQIKRNPPNSLASEQSTQGTGTRTKRVLR